MTEGCDSYSPDLPERAGLTSGHKPAPQLNLLPPKPSRCFPLSLPSTIIMERDIDAWIEQLSQCKQLSEADVKSLCDKVRFDCLRHPFPAVRAG